MYLCKKRMLSLFRLIIVIVTGLNQMSRGGATTGLGWAEAWVKNFETIFLTISNNLLIVSSPAHSMSKLGLFMIWAAREELMFTRSAFCVRHTSKLNSIAVE